MAFRILFQDSYYVAIDKPPGFHVHPPEDRSHRISPQVNCLGLLRDQIGQYLYPVHRLDRATSGVLVFGLSSEAARALSEAFQRHQVQKTYYCVTRGWVEDAGLMESPLRSEPNAEEFLEAQTAFQCVARCELEIAVKPFPKSRYSLVRVNPRSGRRHQIRRHFSHDSHPLIGDTVYGRSEHNRAFRDQLGISGLLLKAYSLEFQHPFRAEGEGGRIRLVSRWNGTWHKVFDLFHFCPWSF